MPDAGRPQPRSARDVLADTVASYLRRAAEWLDDYRDALAKGRGTAPNHLFYAGEAVALAVLATEGLHVGRGEQHQLDAMIARLPNENPFKAAMASYQELTRFATTFRYPTPQGRLKRAEYDEVRQLAAAVAEAHRLAVAHYRVDMSPGANSPAAHLGPPRLSASGSKSGGG